MKLVLAIGLGALSFAAFAAKDIVGGSGYGYENNLDGTKVAGGYGDYTTTSAKPTAAQAKTQQFAQCKKLTSLDLSAATEIGDAAFAYSAMTTLTIPANVTKVGFISFGGCTNLTSVTVKSWAWATGTADLAKKEPFRDCTKLTTLTVPGGVPAVDVKALFAALTTILCPAANVAAWKAAYPSLTVKEPPAYYTIRFNKNDGTGTTSSKTFEYGVSTAMPSFSSLKWARSGFVFKGWATSVANASAGTIWKTDGAKVSTAAKAGATLDVYAVWGLAPGYYAIKFHKNDGSGAWRMLAYQTDVAKNMPTIAVGLAWSVPGKNFLGWATSEEKAVAGTIWKTDAQPMKNVIATGKTLNVYAVWGAGKYKITFVKNEGSGFLETREFDYGVTTPITSLLALKWPRQGYDFLGWALTTADAREGKIWKSDKASIQNAAKVGETLMVYAVWKLQASYYEIRYNKNDGTGKWRTVAYPYGTKKNLPTIANGLQWSRDGYSFGGWATSAAKAAAGTVWKTDAQTIMTAAEPGKTVNAYAIWKPLLKTSVACYLPISAFGGDETLVVEDGYYHGVLLDGTGTYDLLVDDLSSDETTGYVRIQTKEGILSGECVVARGVDGWIVDLGGEWFVLPD